MNPRATSLLVLCFAASALLFAGTASALSFTNSTTITINDGLPGSGGGPDIPSAASPYPSPITPTGLTSAVTKVTVSLNGFTHSFPVDVDVLLVGPNGSTVLLMSDACGGLPGVSNLTVTFDDAAPTNVPGDQACIGTTYKPTNYDGFGLPCPSDPDVFPTNGVPGPQPPAGPYGTALSVFNGMSAATAMSGPWKLYVADDCSDDVGQIVSGWTLNINPTPTAAGLLSFSAAARAGAVELRWRSAGETGLLGYNVFRSGPGGLVRVNGSLVTARSLLGARSDMYRLVDRRVRAGVAYTYRLQTVSQDGTRRWERTARAIARP